MLVKTSSSTLYGLSAITIAIEVFLGKGINFFLVGLPDNAVKESHQRIKAAFKNNNLNFPRREITINMAPADLKKEGSVFDLSIAIGILGVSNQIPTEHLSSHVMIGELSLDGSIQPCRGILSRVMQAKAEGFKGIVIPIQNFNQVAMIKGIKIVPVKHLNEVVAYFQNNRIPAITAAPQTKNKKTPLTDFSEVHAQEHAKRAMEIAAAGGHNLLLIGPPGAGKSMLAERMPSILPDLKIEEAISSTSIHSLVSKHGTMDGLMKNRPYRAPHHTISDVALVGGGTNPKPGEISMAHNGILFLDELPEFKRSTLEVLRQPLENNMVQISRSNLSVEFPASFTLIAAMNPCPCGYFTHPNKSCKCTKKGIEKYKSKISGPLLDRIDLHIQVAPITFHEIQSKKPQEQSHVIKKRVLQARNIQGQRTKNESLASLNAKLSISQIKTYCSLNEEGSDLLKNAMQQLNLSARAYHKILKISRTIADLDGEYDIQTQHVAEAIQYRCLDRELL